MPRINGLSRFVFVDRDEVQRIIASLSLAAPVHSVDPSAVSVFKLDGLKTEWGRRKQIYNILMDFPVKKLGSNFLVIVSRDLVGVVMEVVCCYFSLLFR